MCIILIIRPLQSKTSVRLDQKPLNKTALIKQGDVVEEEFINKIDSLNTIGFLLPTKEYGIYNGDVSVELIINNQRIVKKDYSMSDLIDGNMNYLSFDNMKNIKDKKCKLLFRFSFDEPQEFPIYYLENNESNELLINNKKIDGTFSICLFGSNNDYFYIWYPSLAITVVFTINALLKKEEDHI